MASFTVAKAPVAAPKAFKGLSKATKPAAKVANVSKASEMMVWTPLNNKCAPLFDTVPMDIPRSGLSHAHRDR